MRKEVIFATTLFTVAACQAPVDYSHTYQGDCYQLVKPSVLYQGKCPGIDGFWSGISDCLGLQAFPIQTYGDDRKTIESFSQYVAQSYSWNERLSANYRYEGYILLDEISAGTQFEIEEVLMVQEEFRDPYWSVTVKLLSGKHQGKRAKLPTYAHHLPPTWSTRDPYFAEFVLNEAYTVACN